MSTTHLPRRFPSSRRFLGTSVACCLFLASLGLLAGAEAAGDRELFDRLDITGNGLLTGTEITPEIAGYDSNGDKRLSFEEFVLGRVRERAALLAQSASAASAPVAAKSPGVTAVPAASASTAPMVDDKLPVLPPLKPCLLYTF